MEIVMDVDFFENDIFMEIIMVELQVFEVVYDCVICGQSGFFFED